MNRGPVLLLDLPATGDGRPILSRADLDHCGPPHRSASRERYYCPIHGGDRQRSLAVDPATGRYTCHACRASGTLREYWPAGPSRPDGRRLARALAIEEIGRRTLEARARDEAGRSERLAAEIPAQAVGFVRRCAAMCAALSDPACPGAAYLRARGLDPALAVQLGAGYAPPNAWPGDRGRTVGRIVYPLADPASGRVVSACGRLCVDEGPTWTEGHRAAFASVKQRKLKDCPAGVWPHSSLVSARANARPLVLVEGPADVIAVMQRTGLPLDVLALVGTANVLTAAALVGIPGVVLALDSDGPGAKAAWQVRVELALAGVPVETVSAGWLGPTGAKDPAELARQVYRACLGGEPGDTLDGQTPAGCYRWAGLELHAACGRVMHGASFGAGESRGALPAPLKEG